MAQQRRFLIRLTALALACVMLQGAIGLHELALYLTPLFLIAALLLSGRYIGEDRIVARWLATTALPPRRRRRTQRWRPRAVVALRSIHEQGSFGVRGPPAALAPAA